ncbi:MAG: hypothetical protein MPJ04_00380 [Nitrosopumilus sp.]|nr:hypothetical protein [Nitrosopumilus sp.]MDA7944268.1 hypothetical protein [Nitrosopumilus sp.]MDA7954020.1 hypothetical protein [Nitrosopumilus sp.]MDA7959634.1 hypothetical protein [Nitrosopumilus sp.]MDA7972948.1 hypothetical protein [Nitrosopumilus sp.]
MRDDWLADRDPGHECGWTDSAWSLRVISGSPYKSPERIAFERELGKIQSIIRSAMRK